VHVVGLLLAHGARLDGLSQILVDPVGRLLASVQVRVALLHGAFRLVRYFVLRQANIQTINNS